MNSNSPHFHSMNQNHSNSSTQKKKKFFRLTLKPEDFLDDSPPRKHKVPRNLFPNGQFNNNTKNSRPTFSGFPVNSANNMTNKPLVSIENCDTVNNKRPTLKFTFKPEDFLDTPPKKNKRKANNAKAVSHKQKENNPTLFAMPKKPAPKAHNSGFSFRNKSTTNRRISNRSSTTKTNPSSLLRNPDESQPLLSIDEVGDVLIKKQSVFRERRRFFPSIGSMPKTPDQNKKYSSILNKPTRRMSTLKQKVTPKPASVPAPPAPIQERQEDNSESRIGTDETPPENYIKESLQKSLLKKAITNSIKKNNNNCCTPVNLNSSDTQASSIQSFVRMRVASSRKRLLNLTSQRIVYSSPDTDFLNEEKNCDSTEKLVENINIKKEKCDKETQTDQFSDIFKDLFTASAMLRESLQKLGIKFD